MKQRSLFSFLLFTPIAMSVNALEIDASGVQVLLYDQTSAPSQASQAQGFDAAHDERACEAADDFTVPSAGWSIERITAIGRVSGPITPSQGVHVWIYSDDGGLPGKIVCEYLNAPTEDYEAVDVTLPSSCEVGPGTHWLALQVPLSASNTTYSWWHYRDEDFGNPGVWRNPTNGWSTGCTDWTPTARCQDTDSNDYNFQIWGVGPVPLELQLLSLDCANWIDEGAPE